MRYLFFTLFISLILVGCKSSDITTSEPTREIFLDTLEVSLEPPLPPIQLANNRAFDLLHTKLEVSFNFEQQHLLGKASLTLKPYFYSQKTLQLDAQTFDIQNVSASSSIPEFKLDTFNYDGKTLNLVFNKTLSKSDSVIVYIDYTAKPNESPQKGGAAIREDKGLYFIDPLDTDPNKPTQIWTQGEPEANSNWFPTIDDPQEKCTQEIEITVPNRFKTLSNGELEFSTLNGDGTRTDFWSQNKPHSPYLFMMAIGEFAVVEDFGYDIPINYYVEPKYKEDAEAIFKYTPEMLRFFSERLGVKYPWQKFDQVIVRDYVSGAMENTTAVIFGEFVQKTKRELIDGDNQDIVAHEMFHHWFGDLVTCEDWGNLTINESFATYGPYLWREYKHGRQDADRYLLNNKNSYFEEALFKQETLVRKRYEQPLAMFDRHSYSKGSAVLHMLRNELGDDAFFKGLQYFLETHQHTGVEAVELRLALEEVSGKNLQLFFDNWYYSAGHPAVEAFYFVNDSSNTVNVELTQDKHPKNIYPYFNLNVDVWIVTDNGINKEKLTFFEEEKSYQFNFEGELQNVILDPKGVYLIDWNDNKPFSWWEHQYKNHPYFEQRLRAFEKLSLNVENDSSSKDLVIMGLTDSIPQIQQKAIMQLPFVLPYQSEKIKATCIQLTKNSSSPAVRQASLKFLVNNFSSNGLQSLLQEKLSDSSYAVLGEALIGVYKLNPQMGIVLAEEYEESESITLKLKLAEMYAESGTADKMSFFKSQLENISSGSRNTLVRSWVKWCGNVNQDQITLQVVPIIEQTILNETTWWNRLSLIESQYQLLSFYLEESPENGNDTKAMVASEISKSISRILDAETNPQVLRYF